MKPRSAGITDIGLRRAHNEDCIHLSDNQGIYLVADGMGGHAAGEVASHCAVEEIKNFFNLFSERQDITWPYPYDKRHSPAVNAILCGIRLANRRVYDMQRERPELCGMGTTMAALLITGNTATIAHAGDSRIYRLRGGKLELFTSDHSWVNEQIKRNVITPEEARNHRFRNVITRALGNRLDLEIDISAADIRNGDLFLLCSDGLSGLVEDEKIQDILARDLPLEERAENLVDAANDAGGIDNISAVLVVCQEDAS
ncbi:MAG: Stp1/IreP family PP2C-type Ser/Thr phosphatase [bacterium]|nr:Stp1/IreP family PP2C-type Ser/Thr phosphatase [Candidatus Sumerlaeota bacterium]